MMRKQVKVLPNFSMTDFAFQGKTRTYNVVDLNNCRMHQSYYTGISCSASVVGTLILQGFDAKKITGGASTALRQEFRNLELLDTITCLHFESALPSSISGSMRSELVSGYRKWKGANHIPTTVHAAIQWKKSDPFLEDDVEDVLWELLSNKPAECTSIEDQVNRNKDDENKLPWNPVTPNKRKSGNDDEGHAIQISASAQKSTDQEPP